MLKQSDTGFERLTTFGSDENGERIVRIVSDTRKLCEVHLRLAQYEDIGLSPEEVGKMKKLFDAMDKLRKAVLRSGKKYSEE